MKVGSLFSGIGGLDLGLERAGMEVVWQAESDPYCRAVLRKHWPDVPCFEDVRDIGADAPIVDLICGGFPCQPVSVAGKRLAQEDERWLWPEFARIVRALRPRYVLVENVPGLLTRGMGDVLRDLAESGYDAEWDCIPAAAIGAPHLRYRVFVVAYRQADPSRSDTDSERPHRTPIFEHREAELRDEQDRLTRPLGGNVPHPFGSELRDEPGRRNGAGRPGTAIPGNDGSSRTVADTQGHLRRASGDDGPEASDGSRSELADPSLVGLEGRSKPHGLHGSPARDRSGQPSRGCAGSDAGWWATEPDVGRVANGVPSRVDRLRSLGNAVVPQVAEWIGRQVMATERKGDSA